MFNMIKACLNNFKNNYSLSKNLKSFSFLNDNGNVILLFDSLDSNLSIFIKLKKVKID